MIHSINTLYIGQTASFEKTIAEADLAAAKSPFGKRVAHGALTASLTSTALGMKLPAEGTIFLQQESRYKAPVYIGDTLKAIVEVQELNVEKNIAIFKSTTLNQHGKVVLEGLAKVMPPKAEK
jgi:3-hydroxybutyryl-CoA dehydratase